MGIVIASHDGLTDEQADEIAFDVAGSVAEQIDGEAIAGASVRELLTEGVPAGCEEEPACGRKVAAQLKSDEVLFVVMKKAAKRETALAGHRIARDPDRVPTDGSAVLASNKVKRGKAMKEMVAALYPKGSVTAFVEPPPPEAIVAAKEPEPVKKKDDKPLVKKGWFWGAVAGGAVVLGGAVTGIVFALQPGPSAPSVTLPP